MLYNHDTLAVSGIQRYLDPRCSQLNIEVIEDTDSTNTYVRNKASKAAEGYVVFAHRQTAGRGRRGHSFFSPEGSGIYMTLLLRPSHFSMEQAAKITPMAAVAVCEAIEAISDEQAEIKWVNDIFIHGKKVCGILTEASINPENGDLDYIVLGIGINVSAPENGFPEDISDIAGAVFPTSASTQKNRLAAEILNHFMAYYTCLTVPASTDFTESYRRRCFILGKTIDVLTPQGPKEAVALDIDDDFHLLVKYTDGIKDTLSSGEVSIRKK